jgi:flagellar biosynthesis/type III secretory pathway M-ring protein FliF/YscJ
MGALRQVWTTIGRSLGQLSGRDRMLVASLAVIAAMALVLTGMLSSRQTVVELMPGTNATDQVAATEVLRGAGIPFETSTSGRIMVAPDRQQYALALLTQAGKLPKDSSSLFDSLVKNQNWMASKSQSDQLALAALCEFLGGVISNFQGVERASVIIDAPEPHGMGLAYRKPTASVGVLMKPNTQMDKGTVDAVAAIVSGAKAGLAMSDVKIIDLRNNKQHSARAVDEEFGGAGDYMELVTKIEARVQSKVRELIAYDPGAIVAVSAQVDNTRRRTSTEKFLPDKQGSVSIATRENTSERSEGDATSSGAAPGLGSNVSADVSRPATAPGAVSSDNKAETEFKVAIGSTREEVVDPRGLPTRINVMISLSREYVAHLVTTRKAGAAAGGATAPVGAGAAGAVAAPTQAEIDTAFAEEKRRLETDLTPLIRTAANEQTASSDPRVVVSMIPVPQGLSVISAAGSAMGQAGVLALGSPAVGGGGVMGQLTSGPMLKNAFLGVLAVSALGMMMLMVRKSSRPQELPTAQDIVGLPPQLETKSDVVGEADETDTAMMGIELDDQDVKVKKMLEQVQEMVKKNPSDAAGLLKRWMSPDR